MSELTISVRRVAVLAAALAATIGARAAVAEVKTGEAMTRFALAAAAMLVALAPALALDGERAPRDKERPVRRAARGIAVNGSDRRVMGV